MDFFIVILAGILSGGIINAYNSKIMQLYGRRHANYLDFFYKKVRYIVIEIIVASTFILLYSSYGFTTQFIRYAILTLVLVAASDSDIKTQTVPDKTVIIGIIAGIACIMLSSGKGLLDSVLGFLCASVSLWIISYITKGGIGKGDIKLFACVGIFLGLYNTLMALVVSTVISGLIGAITIILRISNRKSTMPFTPFIFAGTLIALLVT